MQDLLRKTHSLVSSTLLKKQYIANGLWKIRQGNKKKIFYAPAGKKVCVTLKTLNGNDVRSQLGDHAALFISLKSRRRVSVYPG